MKLGDSSVVNLPVARFVFDDLQVENFTPTLLYILAAVGQFGCAI